MLILSDALREHVVAHAREHHPVEACGILAGPAGGQRPTRLIRMRNTLESELAYQFDLAEQIAAYREMDRRGEDPIAIYHSHTRTPPIPSGTDTRFARDLDALYLIVSTASTEPELRAWQLTPHVDPALPQWTERLIEMTPSPTAARRT
jgi:proteasome lid subunit RPN8/RPN11